MLRIKTVTVTPFEQNARVLVDESTQASAVVDPGGNLDVLCSLVRGTRLAMVILTHAHMDHAGKVAELLSATEAETGSRPQLIAHRAELEMRSHVSQQPQLFGFSSSDFDNVGEPDFYVDDGSTITLGEHEAKIFHVPGHSPGHIVVFFAACDFVLEETRWDGEQRGRAPLLFCGDVLFAGSIGRTDLFGGSYDTLRASIKSKVLVLPDETIVLPGHGPKTTVGEEKKTNPFLRGLL